MTGVRADLKEYSQMWGMPERADDPTEHGRPPAPHVSIHGLGHVYEEKGRKVRALSQIDLDIEHGEFVSVVGPSGCGKTTLLRIIGGLLSPAFGVVRVGGSTPDDAKRRQSIGPVFQDSSLLPWRTVAGNVRLSIELRRNRVGKSDDREVDHLLNVVGLAGFRESYPYQLSGGMKQRVALARMLAVSPEIMLMDEPFGSLDEITRTNMGYELLRIWEQRPATVVFVTHSISEADMMSDRVVVMSPRPGRLISTVQIDEPRPRERTIEQSKRLAEYASVIADTLQGAMDEPIAV